MKVTNYVACRDSRTNERRTANTGKMDEQKVDFWQYLVVPTRYSTVHSNTAVSVVNINQDINSQKNNSFELNSPVKNDRRAIARTCPVHVGCVNDELKSSGTFGQTSNTT